MIKTSFSYSKVVLVSIIYVFHGIELLNADVETLDSAKLKIESRKLYVPPLSQLKSGLGGKPTIVEIGGTKYQTPIAHKDKVYDIKTLANYVGHCDKSFVIGAGAGPWPYLNTNIEVYDVNVVLDTPESSATTRIASVNDTNGACILQTLPGNETRFAFTASLFLSKSKPGKVIKVHVKKRIGSDDFISSMQKALSRRYSKKLVGLGGTFVIKKGKVQQHVMKKFPDKPLNTSEEIQANLQVYEMSAPLVALGTFVSAETDLDLRVKHWHSYSSTEGGHYRIDTTPEIVEYLGYFSPGKIFYRMDQPPKGGKISSD